MPNQEDIYRRLDRLEKAIVVNIILSAIVVGEKAVQILSSFLT